MRNGVDFNASSGDRSRRNWQKVQKGALTGTIVVTSPITNNSTAIGLLVDPAGALTVKTAGLGVKLGTSSTLISTGVGGIDLRPQSSTTILAGPATGAAAVPTFRALSTLVDNSTITVTSTGVLAAAPAGVAASTQLTTTAPLAGGGALSTGLTLSIPQATSTANGYLSSTDWTTFNGKQAAGNYVSTGRLINTTAPLAGGGDLSADRTLSIPQASSTANGYLGSTDWTTFNGKQAAFGNQSSTLVYAGPSTGAAAAPTFRHLASTDIPTHSLLFSNTADGVHAVSTTSSTVSLSTALSANFLTAGSVIRVHIHGLYFSSTTNFGTLKIGLFYIPAVGSPVALDGNPAFTPAAGAGGAQFMMDYTLQCRATGASGVMLLTGLEFFNAASVTFGPVDNFGATIDTTQAATLAVVLTWSIASSANIAYADSFTVENLV